MSSNLKKEGRRSYSFEWLYTNKALAVISVILSIVCWIMITLYVSADSKTVVADVPIRMNTEDIEEVHGLQVISVIGPEAIADSKVDIEVCGSIYDISRITADDITVTAQMSSVNTPGEYSLLLSVTCSNRDVSANIKGGYSFIRVWFDRIQQQRFAVDKVTVNGVATSSEDLIIGDYYSAIKSVVLQGPESVVEKIAEVQVITDLDHPLSVTEELPARICYFDAEGNMIEESDKLNIIDYNDLGGTEGGMAGAPTAELITVTVPIRKTASIAIEVPVKNAPEGFDVSSLNYTVTPSEIILEGDIDAIDKLVAAGSYKLEPIDLSALSVRNRTFNLQLNLTTGVEELNGITEVTVVFDISNYSTKRFTVENNGSFEIANADYIKASVTSDSLSFIVIGPKKQIDSLTASDFRVYVDMSNYDGESGQRKMPAVVQINGHDGCWVSGTQVLSVSVEETN